MGAYLRGELNRNDLFQKLNSAIHAFAKRQENWFRKMERNGLVIHWVDGAGDPLGEAREVIKRDMELQNQRHFNKDEGDGRDKVSSNGEGT